MMVVNSGWPHGSFGSSWLHRERRRGVLPKMIRPSGLCVGTLLPTAVHSKDALAPPTARMETAATALWNSMMAQMLVRRVKGSDGLELWLISLCRLESPPCVGVDFVERIAGWIGLLLDYIFIVVAVDMLMIIDLMMKRWCCSLLVVGGVCVGAAAGGDGNHRSPLPSCARRKMPPTKCVY